MLHWCNEVVAGVSRVWRVSRDVTLRHTGQDVESYLINTVAAAADGLIVTLNCGWTQWISISIM